LAIPTGAGAELTKRSRAEWSTAIQSVMIYRGVEIGAEFRVFIFRIDQPALRSERRVWRWMRACVVVGSFMAAIQGRTSRLNRRRTHRLQMHRPPQTRRRNRRVVRSRGPNRGHVVVSRVRNRRVVMLKIVARTDRSGRGLV